MTAPKKFSASIGGYMGPSYNVELTDDALVYKRMSMGYTEEEVAHIEPTDAEWTTFMAAIDELHIWDWKESYPSPPGMRDGTNWSLKLEVGERQLKSSGTNNYPAAESKADEDLFDLFTNALQQLLGGRKFR